MMYFKKYHFELEVYYALIKTIGSILCQAASKYIIVATEYVHAEFIDNYSILVA